MVFPSSTEQRSQLGTCISKVLSQLEICILMALCLRLLVALVVILAVAQPKQVAYPCLVAFPFPVASQFQVTCPSTSVAAASTSIAASCNAVDLPSSNSTSSPGSVASSSASAFVVATSIVSSPVSYCTSAHRIVKLQSTSKLVELVERIKPFVINKNAVGKQIILELLTNLSSTTAELLSSLLQQVKVRALIQLETISFSCECGLHSFLCIGFPTSRPSSLNQ